MDSKQTKETFISLAALGSTLLLKNALENSFNQLMEGDNEKTHVKKDPNWTTAAAWTVAAGIGVLGVKMLVNRVDNRFRTIKDSISQDEDEAENEEGKHLFKKSGHKASARNK